MRQGYPHLALHPPWERYYLEADFLLFIDALLTAFHFLLLKTARTFPLGYHGNTQGVLEGK